MSNSSLRRAGIVVLIWTASWARAQDAGAVAVLVVNNAAGSPPPGMGGTDATITIPSAQITLAEIVDQGLLYRDAG